VNHGRSGSRRAYRRWYLSVVGSVPVGRLFVVVHQSALLPVFQRFRV